MKEDYSIILSLVFICFDITNTSVQNIALRISSVKTAQKYLQKQEVL